MDFIDFEGCLISKNGLNYNSWLLKMLNYTPTKISEEEFILFYRERILEEMYGLYTDFNHRMFYLEWEHNIDMWIVLPYNNEFDIDPLRLLKINKYKLRKVKFKKILNLLKL